MPYHSQYCSNDPCTFIWKRGVRGGLDAIDYEKWRRPSHDFLACSGVVGSLNIMDIPYAASYIAKQAAALQ